MSWRYPENTEDAPDVDDDYAEDYDEDPGESTSWRWIAAVAVLVLVAAVAATAVILRGGDSTTAAGRVVPPASRPTAPPAAVSSSPTMSTTPGPPATLAAPSTSLAPETVTTVAPSASQPSTAAPPPVDPRTIVYSVSGNRQPGDLITVTYTDERGALRTDLDVALPWTRTVVPDAEVLINSVTAVSFASQLNCTITDATGAVVATQNTDTIAAMCNR